MVPEFHLIQSFVRIIPFSNCTLDQELYLFHRSGLLKLVILLSQLFSYKMFVWKLRWQLWPGEPFCRFTWYTWCAIPYNGKPLGSHSCSCHLSMDYYDAMYLRLPLKTTWKLAFVQSTATQTVDMPHYIQVSSLFQELH